MVGGAYYTHEFFIKFMSDKVPELFLFFLHPMGYIIGLGLAVAFNKYVLGFIKYYFKLAHIVYITAYLLEYKAYTSSRFLYSLQQAQTNFASLAVNDFSTRGVAKGLGAVKDKIMDTDIMSRFKEPSNTLLKLITNVCTAGLRNVIDMTDELVVSYTWFANDLHNRSLKGEAKNVKFKAKIKTQLQFLLEGLVFVLRIFPHLLVNTLLFEVAFFFVAHGVAITGLITLIPFVGISWLSIFIAIALYRTLVAIVYYVLIEPLRMIAFLTVFYEQMGELEPFDITESLARLLGKVPVIGALIKKSGQTIEPIADDGSGLIQGDFYQILKGNVKEVASSFNLDDKDILKEEEKVEEEGQEQSTQEVDMFDTSNVINPATPESNPESESVKEDDDEEFTVVQAEVPVEEPAKPTPPTPATEPRKPKFVNQDGDPYEETLVVADDDLFN